MADQKISRLPTDDRDALVLVSQIIDHYQGGFSWQALYAMREVLEARGVEPDADVVAGRALSPITINEQRPDLIPECSECHARGVGREQYS